MIARRVRRAINGGVATQIAFLRAVNVGKRRVAMRRAVEVLEGLGYEDVWSYINSGNLIFEGSGRRRELEATIGEALEAESGFEVTTFARTAAEIRKILTVKPFTMVDSDTHLLHLLPPGRPGRRRRRATRSAHKRLGHASRARARRPLAHARPVVRLAVEVQAVDGSRRVQHEP